VGRYRNGFGKIKKKNRQKDKNEKRNENAKKFKHRKNSGLPIVGNSISFSLFNKGYAVSFLADVRGYLTIKCLKLRDFVFGKWNFSENTGFFTYFPEMGNAEPLILQYFITK
jgi:hypothetical protein